jgi:hypothetical protein
MPRINAVVFIIIDLRTLVGFVALMLAMRQVDRCWPVLALVPISVAMVYDMQDGLIEWGMTRSYPVYPSVSGALQAGYRVNSELIYQYIYKVTSPFIAIMIGLSVALISWAMRKGVFSRWIARLGFVVAAVSIIGGLTTIFPLLLSVGVWYVAVGIQLLSRAGAVGSG